MAGPEDLIDHKVGQRGALLVNAVDPEESEHCPFHGDGGAGPHESHHVVGDAGCTLARRRDLRDVKVQL